MWSSRVFRRITTSIHRRTFLPPPPSSPPPSRWLTAAPDDRKNSPPPSTEAPARWYTAASDDRKKSPATAAAGAVGEEGMTVGEVKKLMRLVNVESLKAKLVDEGKEVIGYGELLKACESAGVARSVTEAAEFARVLDESGVVLLFRDKVYLHPDKVLGK